MLKMLLNIFVKTAAFFRIFLWKQQHNIFCNIINAFTVTFDQLNASLLNKSVHLFLNLT